MYAADTYWGRPVPNFGDPAADRLIVGLAPAAHGGNRTGRIFTGDRSGDWLFRALYDAGACNQPESIGPADGLALQGVMITAIAHCAPPLNKLAREEIANCRPYLEELVGSRSWRAYLCLGSLAWNELLRTLGERAPIKFGHGVEARLESGTFLFGSYHPSQQNTFTGKLTREMLDDVMGRFLRAGR